MKKTKQNKMGEAAQRTRVHTSVVIDAAFEIVPCACAGLRVPVVVAMVLSSCNPLDLQSLQLACWKCSQIKY